MLLYVPNEKHKNLIFFDTEFNDQKLIQIAMIIYEAIELDGIHVYLLKGSINIYVQNSINSFFTRYTGITQDFLYDNAIPEEEARQKISDFIKNLNTKDTLLIAHGLKQDAALLTAMGIDICCMERYCTYNSSKALLNRDKNLKLIDVCNESGYFAEQHDAYSDAKNVVHAFSFLKLIEATAS